VARSRNSSTVAVNNQQDPQQLMMTRRQLFGRMGTGIGLAALGSLIGPHRLFANTNTGSSAIGGLPDMPNLRATAKRIIYLFQGGGPSQHELFDYKPKLRELNGTQLPDSVRRQSRDVKLFEMPDMPDSCSIAASVFNFRQCGQSGTWISELLPHTAKIVDDIVILKSVHTDAANHEPGMLYFQTGSVVSGRPSMGSWVTYGLGSVNQDLPGFVVLVSALPGGFSSSLYGAGFMSSKFQGVRFRAAADPIYFLSNPAGVDREMQRRVTDDIARLNRLEYDVYGDPEIETQIAQYETAYRMQASVPELMDLSGEPESTFALYGSDARTPGTFSANCLLARRLAERDVRFIQLYHGEWDHHSQLPTAISRACQQVDQGSAALIQDLKQRGMLDDTLVIWGGEFGRTVYSEGKLDRNYGRDHHGRCFTMWMAGGGMKCGATHGATDDFSFNITQDAVHVHDVQATILHCLGVDHTKLTYKFQGRYFRLTDVGGTVVSEILA
jgi:Protein of unknown function (DUF1501)